MSEIDLSSLGKNGRYVGPGGPWVPPIISEAITAASSPPSIQAGSGYRYLTTHILTGQVLGDWLPIVGQTFTRQINTSGTGTCALSLDALNPAVTAANIAAVTPRKSVLWVLQEGAVVWSGIVWDWQHQTITDGTLPLNCATLDSILSMRIINTTLTFTSMDVFDMARNLVGYALGKTPNGLLYGLTYDGGESGIKDTVTFDGSQRQSVADALSTLVSTYNIEWAFRPYQDSAGNFLTSFDLATNGALGLPFPQSGLVYNFPGNILDYSFLATGSTSANRVLATATSSNTSGTMLTGRATDNQDLDAGYPLTELYVSASYGDWTSNTQVAGYATGYLPQVTDTQLTPLLTLPGGMYPLAAQTPIGSYAQVSLTSALHPAQADGSPGFSGIGRVTSWTLTPPADQQQESLQVQLGGMTLTGDPGNQDITN